jgi:hypothetical protein
MALKTFITEENFRKKGRWNKSPFNMVPDELKAWEYQEEANVRNDLFSISQPLIYKRHDGILIAEFADGIIKEL